MRSFRKSWIGIVLVILFTASLFFWRQGSYISNILNSDNVIAKVGNTSISTSKFNRVLNLNINQFNQMIGETLSSQQIKDFQIHKLALGALINDAIFENEFENLNFYLDDIIIAKKTKEQIPGLYDTNNQLNEDYLNTFLYDQKLKIEDIVQIISYETKNDIFNSTILDINYPLFFSSNLNDYNNHKRNIDFIKIPIDLIDLENFIEKNITNKEESIKEFYEINKNDYMTDEKRDIKYILVNNKEFIDNFIPTNNEIYEYYNSNKKEFLLNELRTFYQFNFKNKEDGEKFYSEIISLNNNIEIIQLADSKKYKYNKFDKISKNQLSDDIGNELFKLKDNKFSPIFESSLGYHLILLEEIFPENQSSFDEVKDNIKQNIAKNDVQSFFIDLENNISIDILDGLNLEELSKKYDLKINYLNEQTIDASNNEENNIINEIITSSFESNLNYVSDIKRISDNQFYLFEVSKVIKSEYIKYENIKQLVKNNWIKNQKIEKIKSDIDEHVDSKDFLTKLENKYKTEINNLDIRKVNNEIPRDLIIEIYNSSLDKISYSFDQENIYISLLNKILIEKSNNKNKISLNDEIRELLYDELYKKTNISTNDQLLNSIVNNL